MPALTQEQTGPSQLVNLMRRVVASDPERELAADGARRMTYGEALDEGIEVGLFMRTVGVGPEDAVAVILPNWCEFIAVRVAICAARAVIIPLVGNVQPDTLRVMLRDVNPKLIVVADQEHATMARELGFKGVILAVRGDVRGEDVVRYDEVVKGERGIASTVDLDVALPWDDALVDAAAAHPWPLRTSCIIYTSGSEGTPKGVMHNGEMHLFAAQRLASALKVEPDDVFYNPMPFGHIFGMGPGLLVPMIAGGRMVFLERYRPADSCALIERERVSVYFGVPTMYIRDLAANANGEYDFSSLRTGIIAGDITPDGLIRAYEERFGCRVLCSYGMTETSSAITAVCYDDPQSVRYNTAGKPVDGAEVWVVDRDGRECAVGQTGQIVCKTPGLMHGYVNNPEKTALQFDASERFATGDLGNMTPEGALHVSSRLRDLIIRGGMNIFPSEVEGLYSDCSGVEAARLVPYPDSELGQRTCLFVELEPSVKMTGDELRQFAFGRVEKCKVPDSVVILGQMPRLGNGKIDNVALREQLKTVELRHSGAKA